MARPKRRLTQVLAALAAIFGMGVLPLTAMDFYLGTYTSPDKPGGVWKSGLDLESGKLSPVSLVAEVKNPSFVAVSPDGRFLYAAMEHQSGAVGAFRVQPDGSLSALNEQPSGGGGACHVWFGDGHVFVSNYKTGSISCFPVGADGSLSKASDFVVFSGSGPNPNRQTSPHAHGMTTSPDHRFAYACDLGTDQVHAFAFDSANGTLSPLDPPAGVAEPGAGPRHLVISPDGAFLYANNEMAMTVSTYARDSAKGTLQRVQTLSSLPPGVPAQTSGSAEILRDPQGRWIYVSNRGHDSITVFRVRPDGQLEWVENISAGVKTPRGMGLDPTGRWLVVAGQDDGALVSFRVDSETGKLTPVDRLDTDIVPVCVAFPELKN